MLLRSRICIQVTNKHCLLSSRAKLTLAEVFAVHFCACLSLPLPEALLPPGALLPACFTVPAGPLGVCAAACTA